VPLGETEVTAYRGDRGKVAYDHVGIMVNPHGMSVLQDIFTVGKAVVLATEIENTGASTVADFGDRGVRAYSVTANTTITVANVSVGQRVSISLYCDATLRTVAWSGISKWIGGAPVLKASKLTIVTIFNDGVNMIGAWGGED
jgi:hypothetical protein